MSFVLPNTFRKLVSKKLTPIFSEAVHIINQNLDRPRSNQVLIKNKFVGINASDVNLAAGRYFPNDNSLPSALGMEGMGEIVSVGENVSELKQGQSVMYMKFGAFSEYIYVEEDQVIPIASTNVNLLPLLISGTTASLSLDKSGLIVPGEKVLITAAAGGAGHLAVQWAKNAGCHVIGTCSSDEKVDFLKNLGCDRAINYKKECLKDVFKNEYPNGINVIWDSIGGELFDTLFKHLSIKGRLVVVGAISNYTNEHIEQDIKNISLKVLLRSSMINGFFLPHFTSDIPHYLNILVRLLHEQKLRPFIDDGSSIGKPFKGLEDINRAVEYLYSGKNKGKVVLTL